MEALIIEYINKTYTVQGCNRITVGTKQAYYEDVLSHLNKVFRLKQHEVNGYMIHCIFEVNPEFFYGSWMDDKAPEVFSMRFDYGHIEQAQDRALREPIVPDSLMAISLAMSTHELSEELLEYRLDLDE